MKCANCGAELQTGSKFCNFCGASLPIGEVAVPDPRQCQCETGKGAFVVAHVLSIVALCTYCVTWSYNLISFYYRIVKQIKEFHRLYYYHNKYESIVDFLSSSDHLLDLALRLAQLAWVVCLILAVMLITNRLRRAKH